MDLPNAHFFVKEALDRILFKYENLEDEVKTLRAVLKGHHKNGCLPDPDPPQELVDEIKKITITITEEDTIPHCPKCDNDGCANDDKLIHCGECNEDFIIADIDNKKLLDIVNKDSDKNIKELDTFIGENGMIHTYPPDYNMSDMPSPKTEKLIDKFVADYEIKKSIEEKNAKVLKDLDEVKWSGGKFKIKDHKEWDNETRLKMIKKKVKKVCKDNNYIEKLNDNSWKWKYSDSKVWIHIDISVSPF